MELLFLDAITTEHFIAFLLIVITGLVTLSFFMIKGYLAHRIAKDDKIDNALNVNAKDHTDILLRLQKGAMKLDEVDDLSKKVNCHEKKINEHDIVIKQHDEIIKGGKYKVV